MADRLFVAASAAQRTQIHAPGLGTATVFGGVFGIHLWRRAERGAMYFRCLATDILGVARRTQRFQGRFASNRLWNLVRRWFPAAFPWAGAAAEPTGSVQSRIGKPQSLGFRLRRGSKDDGQVRALGIESGADLRRQNPRFPTGPLWQVRSGTVCSSPNQPRPEASPAFWFDKAAATACYSQIR